jgi:hypothetical protein
MTMQDQSQGRTRQDLDWFRPSRRVITLRPILLYYAVERLVAPDELRAATYIIKELPYRYSKFPIPLQSQQTCT